MTGGVGGNRASDPESRASDPESRMGVVSKSGWSPLTIYRCRPDRLGAHTEDHCDLVHDKLCLSQMVHLRALSDMTEWGTETAHIGPHVRRLELVVVDLLEVQSPNDRRHGVEVVVVVVG